MGLPLQPDPQPKPWWWRNLPAFIIAAAVLLLASYLSRGSEARTRVLLTSPDGCPEFYRQLERSIALAHERVWVMVYVLRFRESSSDAAYGLCKALARAARDGRDVRVVLDQGKEWGKEELSDKTVEPARWLRAHGVRVILDEVTTISHAKVVLIDQDLAFVGSHNWTATSLERNREASLMVRDAAIVRRLEALFVSVPGWDAAAGEAAPHP